MNFTTTKCPKQGLAKHNPQDVSLGVVFMAATLQRSMLPNSVCMDFPSALLGATEADAPVLLVAELEAAAEADAPVLLVEELEAAAASSRHASSKPFSPEGTTPAGGLVLLAAVEVLARLVAARLAAATPDD